MATDSRLRRFGVALVATAAVAAGSLGAGLVSASPAAADPTPSIGSLTQKLADLARKNEGLTEAYNQANIDAQAKKDAADRARRDARAAAAKYAAAHAALSSTIVASYKTVGSGQTSALLTSRSGQNYVDQVTTLSILGSRRTDVVGNAKRAKAAASAADTKAQNLAADAHRHLTALATQRSALQKDIDSYTAQLNVLTVAQRAALQNKIGGKAATTTTPSADGGTSTTTNTTVTSTVPAPSKRAQIAVNYALAQQGKPYVFAASGPDSFDCSGLTAAAWGVAGVSLPHFAATQYDYGTHVSVSQLAPGDLVFFYQPIEHVAMYIGNGLIVHAPEPGDVVKVVPLSEFGSDYVGATRLS